jgi:carotenoid cleavage dioxygenase-like enzyme
MTVDETTRTELPWHLRNNWAPVLDERTDVELRVDGVIPTELQGVYVRTGPNPVSGRSEHWFYGDGMVHGVRLAGGKAEWYRNRFVQTPNVTGTGGGDPMANMGNLAHGTGNTHVMAHNKKLLCLEEAHWPWEIDTELNTIGFENFGGALTTSMTAHPKVCPITGELIAFSYLSPQPPYLHYIRISADGVVQQLEGIDIPNMVMMHDFNVTQHHVVFMDLPVVFDLAALATGLPFQFDRDAGARLGVMPRTGTNADVRWFDIDPCYVFHPVNAHEVGNTLVLHVSRQPEAFGTSNDDYAEVGRLWRWTIDLDAGTVTEEQIDDRPGDFGRVDDRLIGLDARYGYLMAMAGEGNAEEPVYGSALWKYDLRTGACVEHQLGDGVRGAEPVFAPAAVDSGEDEGWIISLSHDTTSDESRLLIIDAQNFSAPPVATIHLPRRVPYGAHGSWVPDHIMA